MQQDSDRRIRRTKRELAAALIELTAERPYASIQVRDITERADVGYATFYRHYENKDDLMLAVFAQIYAELESSAGEAGEDHFRQEGCLLFAHVQKYEGLYRGILENPAFVRQLKALLAQRIAEHLQADAARMEALAFPVDLAAHHMVTAIIGLIEWWLAHERALPAAEMARIYERLVIQATWVALNGQGMLADWERLHQNHA